MSSEKDIIRKIIQKHGAVIDLNARPEVMIEILRRFRFEEDDGGAPGGAPPAPPPGPTSFQDRVTNEDLLRAVQQLARQVKAMAKPAAAKSSRKKTR
jgi:hypothetical protein